MKNCYNCMERVSYPKFEACRLSGKFIELRFDEGEDCDHWDKRACIFCHWYHSNNSICPHKPVNSCWAFLGC